MRKVNVRLLVALVILLVALAASNAQIIGKRFAPKGTFNGDPSVLTAIARSNPAIANYYTDKFGVGWNQPGALKVIGGPIPIPDGGAVPGNAILDKNGKVREMLTHQRGADRAWLVENSLTNQKMLVKSCGQGFTAEMPKNPPPAALETDYEIYVTAGATASAEAKASATANSTSSATGNGGNASLVFNAPQPTWVPQPRVLATQGSERYQVAGITWLPQIRQTQTQGQNQQQQQEQQQQQQQQMQQMQQQLQEILNRIGIG